MRRTHALNRLAKLYSMVEDLNALQVKAAAAAVFEVECAALELRTQRLEAVAESRAGLARGSRMETLAVEEIARKDGERAVLLARLGTERRLRLDAVVEAHRESRVEARQIDGLAKAVRAVEDAGRARRAQAESDDRFLSRRSWPGVEVE